MDQKTPKITKQQAVRELWLRSNISWKLKPHQKELYDLFYQSDAKVQTWLLARRSGKSFCLCLLAIEICLKTPNSIVKFLSPTRKQVETNIRPLMRMILQDCPEEIRPEFKAKDYVYYFPNGSEIQLAGSEAGNIEKLRGGFSHIAIIDEAQDVTDLNDAVKSVLLPTTLTTKGKILLAGTPPKSADHDFITFVEDAELRGSLVKKTIYDNTMLSKEIVEETKKEYGGETSEEFRREYLCEIIKDPTYSVLPEFTQELEQEIVKEWPKPPFYQTYEAMDLGFKDLTAVLFAYYDFRADKVIIEDEIAVNGTNLQLPTLIQDIKNKELALWTNPYTNEVTKPSVRVSDINYIVTQEIARASNGEINFTAAKKDDKEAAINKLRVLLQSKKIIIHPKCVNLIRHLKNVRWDKSRKGNSFARSPDDGHYDFVDCAIYLIRHINYTTNPYPWNYNNDLRREDVFVSNPSNFAKSTTNSVDIYKRIFGIKGRK